MARKRKNKDLIEEKGVGYIKIQVVAVRKNGNITDRYTTKFGFASIYTMAELKQAAKKLKELAVISVRNENQDVEKITASAKIFHTECEYLVPPAEAPKKQS